jgi:hypothetical protein
MSMFDTGFGSKIPSNYLEPPYKVRRFYLKNGQRKQIIILGDDAPVVREYVVKVPTRDDKIQYYYATDLSHMGMVDPLEALCRNLADPRKIDRQTTRLITVLDVEGYTDKDEIKHTYEKVILAVKQRVDEMLRSIYTDNMQESGDTQGLAGALLAMTRGTSPQAASTGDPQFRKFVDISNIVNAQGIQVDTSPIPSETFAPNPEWNAKLCEYAKSKYGVVKSAGSTPTPIVETESVPF